MSIKPVLKRLICMLLTLCLLLGICVLVQAGPESADAVENDTPISTVEPTDEELIAKYSIADDWARPALLFALKKGLLSGKSGNNLAPKDPATRAELAAVFMKLLQTNTAASLSGYTDVDSNKWYYEPLARAVAAGLLTGTSKTTLSPEDPVTREQAFTLFSRAFGITGDDTFRLYGFKDGQSVSSWAAASIAAMIKAGYISGTDGNLEPKKLVTRQELAQLFYTSVTDITDEIPPAFTGTLAAASDTVAFGTYISGDLLLCSESPTITLEKIAVTGRLIIQGCGPLSLMLNDCKINELVLCRPTTLYSKSGIDKVTVLSSGSTLNGAYSKIDLRASTLLNGSVNEITLSSHSSTLSEESKTEKLIIAPSALGSTVTINGQASSVVIQAKRITVKGTGSIGELTLTKDDSIIECPFESRISAPDVGLRSTTITRTDSTMPSEEKPKATINVSFTSSGSSTRSCGVLWYVNGILFKWSENVQFSPKGTASCEFDFTPYMKNSTKVEISVKLVYQNEVTMQTFSVTLDSALYRQAKNMKTLDVPAKIKYQVSLYSRYGHKYLRTLEAGTIVYHKEYTTNEARVTLKDGTEGWVPRYCYSIISGNYFVTWDYAKEVKELYVNEIRNLSSKTDYLVWVNLYTQKANIFKGTQGHWKLIRVCPVGTGANTMVTVDQLTEILYKTKAWHFSEGTYVHHVSVIDYAGRAFHSRLYWTSNGSLCDGTIGRPVSHGCIRMYDEDCTFIYNTVPTGTAVLVY